jgi:hypothetical protein
VPSISTPARTKVAGTLGQVLDLVGGLGAGPGAEVEVVKLIDEDQGRAQRAEQVADLAGDLDLAEP